MNAASWIILIILIAIVLIILYFLVKSKGKTCSCCSEESCPYKNKKECKK